MKTLGELAPRVLFEVASVREDVLVRAEHGKVDCVSWPGDHKYVYVWWELEDGTCVGHNEKPGRETFPIMKLPKGCNAPLVIKLPNVHHNNFGLELHSHKTKVEHFNTIAHRELSSSRIDDSRYDEKRSWGTFWQGSDETWLYLEFWMARTPETWARVVKKALEIGAELGVEVRLRDSKGEIVNGAHADKLPEGVEVE